MNLIEKRTELLKLKKEIAWVSSEWYDIEKELETNCIYNDRLVRHVRILHDYLSALILEIELYKEYLSAEYIQSMNSISNRMKMILKDKIKHCTRAVN